MRHGKMLSHVLTAGLGMLLVSLVGACAAASDMTDEGSDDSSLWAVAKPGTTPAADPEATAGDDKGVPGEDEADILAGCSHIQWCNEPGPVGTVCIWDACSFDAARAECTSDANFVCGGITQPAEIR